MCGLRQVWRDELGLSERFDSDTRIDHHLEADGFLDHVDFGDVIHDIEELFDFHCPEEEWRRFLGSDVHDPDEWQETVGPHFTFGGLAELIIENTDAISLGPTLVLGQSCKTAGVFSGIEQLAQRIMPKVALFTPNTLIRSRFRGRRLDELWCKLRWMSLDRLPPLSRPKYGSVFSWNLLIGGGAILLAIAWGLIPIFSWRLLYAIFFLVGLYYAAAAFYFISNPLPKGISTFGELARVIADDTDNETRSADSK
jgi:acyl carrier protein